MKKCYDLYQDWCDVKRRRCEWRCFLSLLNAVTGSCLKTAAVDSSSRNKRKCLKMMFASRQVKGVVDKYQLHTFRRLEIKRMKSRCTI